MSLNTLEKVLWDLSVDRDSKKQFAADPQSFVSRYPLDTQEKQMVLKFDVKAMAALGVSTMLTMGYWMQVEGSRDMGEYLRRMRT